MIVDPHNQPLEALPFVSSRARAQTCEIIRRVFDATRREQPYNFRAMLHLTTQSRPSLLLEMSASVVHTRSDVVVILTGREVDSGLAGLLHEVESTTTSEEERNRDLWGELPRHGPVPEDGCSNISSLTLPSGVSLARDRGGEQNTGAMIIN